MLEDNENSSKKNLKKCENNRVLKDNKLELISGEQLIKDGVFAIITTVLSYKQTLEPIANMLEILTLSKAEKSRNPSWYIFMAKNAFGKTPQYVDQVHQKFTVQNLIDEMTDDEIARAVETRPNS